MHVLRTTNVHETLPRSGVPHQTFPARIFLTFMIVALPLRPFRIHLTPIIVLMIVPMTIMAVQTASVRSPRLLHASQPNRTSLEHHIRLFAPHVRSVIVIMAYEKLISFAGFTVAPVVFVQWEMCSRVR